MGKVWALGMAAMVTSIFEESLVFFFFFFIKKEFKIQGVGI